MSAYLVARRGASGLGVDGWRETGERRKQAGVMANPSLLLVEEGALVLDALEVGLGRRFGGDYGILSHRSPVSALATLQDLAERSEDVALLIAGQHMQEMSGIEFLTAAHQLHPGAKRVLLIERNYRATSPAVEAISQGKIDYHLTKPWFNERSLYLAVSEMLADWAKAEDPGLAVFRVVGPSGVSACTTSGSSSGGRVCQLGITPRSRKRGAVYCAMSASTARDCPWSCGTTDMCSSIRQRPKFSRRWARIRCSVWSRAILRSLGQARPALRQRWPPPRKDWTRSC